MGLEIGFDDFRRIYRKSFLLRRVFDVRNIYIYLA